MEHRARMDAQLSELVALLLDEGCVSAECVAKVIDRELTWGEQRRLLVALLLDGVEAVLPPFD